jgi:hypothetical protein
MHNSNILIVSTSLCQTGRTGCNQKEELPFTKILSYHCLAQAVGFMQKFGNMLRVATFNEPRFYQELDAL